MIDSDLDFFINLSRRANFTATARDLGISPSAVSRRLARIEDRLGVRLVNRTTRRVSLTAEGETYFREAVRILGDIDALEQGLTQASETPRGLLRINATLGFGRTYLAPAISAYKLQFPDVEIQLVLTDAPLNLVEEGFDLGIRFGIPSAGRLVMRRLLQNRRLLCAAPSYLERQGVPKALDDLRAHNCIVLRQDQDAYDLWRFDELDGDLPSIRVKGNLSTNDGETALGWVLEGHGVMLRSEWDIARLVQQGRLRIVLPRYVQTAHISAVYPDRHNLSARLRSFLDYLVPRLRDIEMQVPLSLDSVTVDAAISPDP